MIFCATAWLCTTASGKQIADLESSARELSREWNRSSLSRAASAYQEAGQARLKSNEFKEAIDDLIQAGRILVILEEKSDAKRILSRSYNIAKRAGYLTGRIESLSELALIEVNQGDLGMTRHYLDEANALSELSVDPKAKGIVLFSNSEYQYYKREIPSSITSLKRAIEFARQANAGDDEAKYHRSLGYAYLAVEDQKNALESINSALAIWRSLGDKRGVALSSIALGYALSNYENNQKALEVYTTVEREFPDDVDLLEKASLCNGIGRIYLDYGNWKLSLDYREKALTLFQKGGDKFGVTATLSRIAILTSLITPENRDLVMKKFETALDYARSVHDGYYSSLVMVEKGSYCFRIHDYEDAVRNYGIAVEYFRSTKDKRVTADIDSKLAEVYASQGKTGVARQRLNEALVLNTQIADRFAEAQNLAFLSVLDHLDNNDEDALKNIKRSLELTESLYSEVPNQNLQGSYLSEVYSRYEFYIERLMQKSRDLPKDGLDIQALVVSEQARSRSLLETMRLSEADFLRDAPLESIEREKELLTQLNGQKAILTGLLNSTAGNDEIENVERDIRSLQKQLEDVKAGLKQQSPIYSAIKHPDPFDVSMFQRSVLDDNSILLEFSLSEKESYLWAVGKTTVESFVLPPREVIEARIERLRSYLGARDILPGESTEDYQRRLGEADVAYSQEAGLLANELLGQVADKIEGKRIIVVADGKLHYFPLASLPRPNAGTDEPILIKNEIVYEPSASALQIIKSSSAAVKAPQKDLLVFADPVFSKDDDRLTGLDLENTDLTSTVLGLFRSGGSIDELPRLPASADEARLIAEAVGTSRSTIRLGFEANRENVLSSDISDYKILHFATHGVIDEKRPELSGIVLSIFRKDGALQDGGFIRLQDVYEMKLNADLVVLSACSTGVGKEVKGEGLMSLNNAFLQAGARSVVSSLWKVDDNATKEIMKEFYRGLADEDLSPAAAMRRAQIRMYRDPRFQSPFYWASFTVEGDYSTLPTLGHPLDRRYLLLGIVPLLLIAGYFLRSRWG